MKLVVLCLLGLSGSLANVTVKDTRTTFGAVPENGECKTNAECAQKLTCGTLKEEETSKCIPCEKCYDDVGNTCQSPINCQ